MASSVVRRGLLAAAIIVTIAFVLLGMAHLPVVRAGVLEWARTRVSEDLGIAIEASALRYNLLSGSLEVSDLALSSRGERPFLRADSARIVLARSVWWGTIELLHLEAIRPQLVVVRHADGTTNLPTGGSGSSASSTPLRLGTIQLSQLTVEVADDDGRALAVGPIDLTLDSSPARPRPGAFGPSAFTASLPASDVAAAPTVVSGTLTGRLGFDGRQLSVPELHIETPDGRLDLDGALDIVGETPGVQASGRLEIDLARARRLVGLTDTAILGSAAAEFEITGSLTDPAVRIGVLGQDLGYRTVTGAGLSANATYSSGRLAIERFDVTSSVGEAHANGTLILATSAGPSPASQIVLRLTEIRLDSLTGIADVATPVPLGAIASADLDATWGTVEPSTADWLQRLSADMHVRLTPTGLGLSLGGDVDGRLRAGQWTVEHALQSTALGADLGGTATGQVNRTTNERIDSTLSVQSRLRTDNLGAVVPVLRQAGFELPSPIDENLRGSLDALLESQSTLRAPSLLATIEARDVTVAELPSGDLSSTLAIDRETVRARSLEARLGSVRLDAAGQYAWSGQITGRFDVTASDLGEAVRSFGFADVPVAGSGRLAGTFQGDVQSPRARASLTANNLSVYDTPIGAVSSMLELAGRRLEIEASAPQLNLQIQGELDTREPLDYQLVANLDRTSIAAVLPGPLRERILTRDGTVSARVTAHGELRQPLQATVETVVRSLEADLSGVPVVLDAPATISFGPANVTTTTLSLRLGRETRVRLQGALSRNTALEGLELQLDGALSDLVALAAPIVPEVSIDADGTIGIDVRVGGTLLAPEPEGTITVRDAALHYSDHERDLPPLTEISLSGRIEPASIVLQSLDARWQGARIAAEGALPFRMIAPEPPPAGTAGQTTWGAEWLASCPKSQAPPRSSQGSANSVRPFSVPSSPRHDFRASKGRPRSPSPPKPTLSRWIAFDRRLSSSRGR